MQFDTKCVWCTVIRCIDVHVYLNIYKLLKYTSNEFLSFNLNIIRLMLQILMKNNYMYYVTYNII